MAERAPNGVAKLIVLRAIQFADHFSVATGKTIAITISKNGGAFGNPNVGALNATEISSGFYKFTLDTTDTNTNGPLAWRGAGTGVDDIGDVIEVVALMVDANVKRINDVLITGNGSPGTEFGV